VIVGGGGWTREACAHAALHRGNGLPVGTSFRCQDLFDNRIPNYAGDVGIGINPKLARAREGLPTCCSPIGARLGEMTTGGYTLLEAARCRSRRWCTCMPAPRSSAASTRPRSDQLGIRSSPPRQGDEPVDGRAGRTRRPQAHADYLEWTSSRGRCRARSTWARSSRWLNKRLPDDAIVTNGAGNFAGWLHRFFRYRGFRTQLAPTNGSMGYGVPAAVAAKLAEPERTVVSLAATATS
jgi:acetolactate synthase-1/2/3 large subunit